MTTSSIPASTLASGITGAESPLEKQARSDYDRACQLGFTLPVFAIAPRADWRPGDPAHSAYIPAEGWQNANRRTRHSSLGKWQPGHALSLITGPASGLAVVDVDAHKGAKVKDHRDRLAVFGVEILGEVRTASGGAHLYTVDVGLRATNIKNVDYLANGSMAYLPGTLHPAKVPGVYEWVQPLDLERLAEIRADEVRLEEQAGAVCAYLGGIGAKPRAVGAAGEVEVPSEGEPLGQLPHWLELELDNLGPQWTDKAGRRYRDNSRRWHHLVNACQRAELTPGQTVTALELFVETCIPRYKGREGLEVARSLANAAAADTGAARATVKASAPAKVEREVVDVREARHTPAPAVEPAPSVPVTVNASTATARKAAKATAPVPAPAAEVEADVEVDAEEWPTPQPLETTTATPIPLDELPALVRETVEAYTEASQSPPEVVLGAVLGAAAAATRGVWDIPVDGRYNAGPTVLYVCSLASSGERKDAGQSPIVEPLVDAERRIRADVRAANRRREQERKRLERKLREAEKLDDDAEVDRLTEKLHEHRARPVPHLIISDTTPEALGVNLEKQGGAAAVFSTEATAFRTVAGAYSDAGGNYGLLNNAYDGTTHSEWRVGRPGATVERPALTWCTAVQPEVLAKYARGLATDTGFLPRFLLLVPESRVGYRNMRPRPVPADVAARLARALTELHAVAWEHYQAMTDDLPDDLGRPRQISLSAEALELHLEHAEALEVEKRTSSALAGLGGWLEKHPTRLIRIAALFELLANPEATRISGANMRAALSLSRPLIAHGLATFALVRGVNGGEPEARVLDAIREVDAGVVSTRQVHQKVRGQTSWCHSAHDVREVLETLEGMGWVRHNGTGKAPGEKGRPSETWAVYPGLISDQD